MQIDLKPISVCPANASEELRYRELMQQHHRACAWHHPSNAPTGRCQARAAHPSRALGHKNSGHYVIDWNFHEDRSRIRTGNGPANVTRLRRFAVGVIQCV